MLQQLKDRLRLQRASVQPEVRREPILGEQGDGSHPTVVGADPFSFRASYRRTAWLLRLSVGANIALCAVVVVLAQTVSVAFPLKETEIALLRVDPQDSRIYRVAPIAENVDGFELMLEQMASRFVVQILSIDGMTQNTRFKEVRRFSDPVFFNDFLDDHKSTIDEAIKDGLNRSITVHGANLVDSYDGVYQYSVEFTRTDRVKGRAPVTKRLIAYLEMAPKPQQVKESEKFDNPLGVRVLGLQVKEVPNA